MGLSEGSPSKDDLRFDLSEFQLGNAPSEETDAPTASTLYDPAMLALSPEYRAKVEERQARSPLHEGTDEGELSPFHVASPSPDPQRTFDLPVGEGTIRLPESEGGPEDDRERELCCHGLLPLYHSLIFFNVVNMAIGFLSIGIGAVQLNKGTRDLVGLSSMERLVVSGSYLFAIVFILLGVLFAICGAFGIWINVARLKKAPTSARCLDILYHCLLFLITILTAILLGLNIYAATTTGKHSVYSQEIWEEFVRSDSLHLCKVEEKLNCAGYNAVGQCVSPSNETRHTFCPGHFCVDFCRIATDDVNVQPICESCRRDPLNSISAFLDCRSFEKGQTAIQSCQGLPDEELKKSYQRLITAAVICFTWIIVVWVMLAYIHCFS